MGNARNIAFWVVLFLLILALFNLFSGSGNTLQSQTIGYSEFVRAVENEQVSRATLDGESIRYRSTDGRDYVTIKPEDAQVTDLLIANNVPVSAESQQQSGFQTFILSLLPFLLLIGVWVYFMNRMQGGGKGGAMGFGKSKAKLLTEKHGRVTFD
ncbi:MAG TPA: ATP-dependent metallopeptidase FtsH/Yme1/Tma family protein, partial [Paracoccaceae bacterium]|nr:ATP-dependent metallopeptidase FtsH/Yme1/Tma family protein [Paracoccaceae bacterium]